MQKFWMVYKEMGGGGPTRKHDTLESAQNEAARLATEQGHRFVVLEAVKACTRTGYPVAWEDAEVEIPF